MKAIVTIKLPRNPYHDPKNKQTGLCPINHKVCTDVTGEHHSYIETGNDLVDIVTKARLRAVGIFPLKGVAPFTAHVTRVEAIE